MGLAIIFVIQNQQWIPIIIFMILNQQWDPPTATIIFIYMLAINDVIHRYFMIDYVNQ